tara:strand:+ start:1433 stop:1699 length:267 start_codon:yes stop_codon:yes gene_type:complete
MNRNGWTKKASDLLLGKRIVKVEYMPKKEAEQTGWYSCPILLQLEDGSWLIPQRDDEGNDGGAIGISNGIVGERSEYHILPVLGVNHE